MSTSLINLALARERTSGMKLQFSSKTKVGMLNVFDPSIACVIIGVISTTLNISYGMYQRETYEKKNCDVRSGEKNFIRKVIGCNYFPNHIIRNLDR